MKKFLKITGLVLGLGVVALFIIGWIYSQPLPDGKSGPEADALAQKMLEALNVEKYKETRYLEWSFRNGTNNFMWDKELGMVTVIWDKTKVVLNLVAPSKSKVFKDERLVTDDNRTKPIAKAQEYFNNDSFWLVAPYKVFDKGTKRSIVELEDGSQGLLITYTSGGDTPGDSYLWLLNENGFPNSFKMWVSVIPIGGLEASWDDWVLSESGAFLPKSHKMGPVTLGMGDVKGYN